MRLGNFVWFDSHSAPYKCAVNMYVGVFSFVWLTQALIIRLIIQCRLNYSHSEYKSEFGRNKTEATQTYANVWQHVWPASLMFRMETDNFEVTDFQMDPQSFKKAKKLFRIFFYSIRGYSIPIIWIRNSETRWIDGHSQLILCVIFWSILFLLSVLTCLSNRAVVIRFCLWWLNELYFKYMH